MRKNNNKVWKIRDKKMKMMRNKDVQKINEEGTEEVDG